jgi:hypothetical protein
MPIETYLQLTVPVDPGTPDGHQTTLGFSFPQVKYSEAPANGSPSTSLRLALLHIRTMACTDNLLTRQTVLLERDCSQRREGQDDR